MIALYTFTRLRSPVWVWLLVGSARGATLLSPRSDGCRRRVLAILPSVLTCPARGADAVVDAFDLGTPTASAGDAGAHPAWSLRGRWPSSGGLWASRRNGRGVGSPRTGWRVDGLQQRVGKASVIVLQDGQAESRSAARLCWCRAGSSGGSIREQGWSHAHSLKRGDDEMRSNGDQGPGRRKNAHGLVWRLGQSRQARRAWARLLDRQSRPKPYHAYSTSRWKFGWRRARGHSCTAARVGRDAAIGREEGGGVSV